MSSGGENVASPVVALLWRALLLLLRIAAVVAVTVVLIGCTLGFFFKFYPWTVGYVIFMNHVHFPPFRNFSDFESHELRGENLYLPSGVNKLGVWKLEPHFHSDTSPVVIYIHGAQGSRAAYHRIQMYRLLLKIGSPVVTFDYRGYGDSTGIPTSELDLLQDTMVVYRWTREQFPDRPLLLWAHSLGTGVSVRLVETLEKSSLDHSNDLVNGLILDSPYSSMMDVMRLNPLLRLFHQVPAFTETLLYALHEADVTLNSSDRIRHTRVPLLILHAEDDWVIPVSLGRKLYAVAERRSSGSPDMVSEYVEYSAALKFGHRGIYRDPLLAERVVKFAARATAVTWKSAGRRDVAA